MTKIIVFPGSAENVFYLKEIKYISEYFDDITVFSFSKTNKTHMENSKIRIINVKFIAANILNPHFIKWIFLKETRDEIRNVLRLNHKLKNIIYIMFYGLYYVATKKKVELELKKDKSNKVFLYSFWLTRGAYIISKFSHEKNVEKSISRAHGYDLYMNRSSTGYLPFRNFIGNNIDEISFISEQGKRYYAEQYSNTSALKTVHRLGTYNPGVRKIINKKNYVDIVSCSYITEIKRIDLIIELLTELSIPYKWTHIGSGDMETEIKQLAHKKLNNDNYVFLGNIDNKEILQTLINIDADFLLNLSDSEGIPVSIMEALSIGVPCIARNVGGISEIVNDDIGLLLPINFEKDMFLSLITNELRKRIYSHDIYIDKSQKAVNFWYHNFDSEKNLRNFFYEVRNE